MTETKITPLALSDLVYERMEFFIQPPLPNAGEGRGEGENNRKPKALRIAPSTTALNAGAFEKAAAAQKSSRVKGAPAHPEKPRLNPVLLALHMHAAKNPPPRIIDTDNRF